MAYRDGLQLDECALPILLVDLAFREGALSEAELPGVWPMIEKAAGFIVRNGPVTVQGRWEEDGGYSPFTLAAEIAALLVAADFADRLAAPKQAAYLREAADIRNSLVEHWTYVSGTPLAHQIGVDGYYVRIACRHVAVGHVLRVELLSAALVHWSADGWHTTHDTPTEDSGLGVHFADLATADLKPADAVVLTIFWIAENRWEGVDYQLAFV